MHRPRGTWGLSRVSIITIIESGMATIMLDRPERLNAIDLAMTEALDAALADAFARDDVRVIVLRGAGRAFCAGDDIEAQSEICDAGERALARQLDVLQRISERLVLGSKPSIVAVHGWAVGAAFSWVANCDLAIWSDGAIAFLPELGFGTFFTGGVTWLLPRLVGPRAAADIMLRGRRIAAPEALTLGLANDVVPETSLDGAVAALAATLAALPPAGVALLKRALSGPDADAFRAALRAEARACIATTLDPATIARMRAALARGR